MKQIRATYMPAIAQHTQVNAVLNQPSYRVLGSVQACVPPRRLYKLQSLIMNKEKKQKGYYKELNIMC